VAVLIVPNIAMDLIQLRRQGDIRATVRRLAVLLLFGAIGTVCGTRVLVILPARTASFILGCFVLLFVALNATRFSPRVPPRWEPWLAAPMGLVAGVVGGVTNGPGTPLVMYFYALGMAKADFVRATALSFVAYKIVQLGAVAWYGLLTWPLLGISLALTIVALAGFAAGLRVQDRLDQRAFNRAVLVFLAALGLWLTLREL
jgi:uncharacterized membrane protein YfcA